MISVDKVIFALILIIHLPFCLQAQLVGDMEDESKLYAETKQVNQFFRRFNGEEDEQGNRYYAKDRKYRNEKLRKKYVEILFDNSNRNIDDELKRAFSQDIIEESPQFLNFRKEGWYAEVQTTFIKAGKNLSVTLFLKLEKAQQGRKWNIFKVYSDHYAKHFKKDTTQVYPFIHPMSHELDFMNLRKAFNKKDSINQYTVKNFKADQLSVLMYEVSDGAITFKTVNDVTFHFFQLDNWYFEISEFNRDGYNRGWLISSLTRFKNEKEKQLLKDYLFYESSY